MKWVLIMYFLYFGPPISWNETDRRYYPDHQSCIEAKQDFDIVTLYLLEFRLDVNKLKIKHSYNL